MPLQHGHKLDKKDLTSLIQETWHNLVVLQILQTIGLMQAVTGKSRGGLRGGCHIHLVTAHVPPNRVPFSALSAPLTGCFWPKI